MVATTALLRDLVAGWRRDGLSVGLVRAAAVENERVVVSIFVNPLQFGPGEDFARYPRDLGGDLEALDGMGVGAVFAPRLEEMYPSGATTRVRVGELDEVLEGARRPGHFEGVATVVTKLFWAAQPDRAYFGQKDAQQAALVTRLAEDLSTGISIRVCPIVREPDGLALSSRNAYLSAAERKAALVLSRALSRANEACLAAEPLAKPDYAEVVDPADFRSPGRLAVLAVRIGSTRLIDNHLLGDRF